MGETARVADHASRHRDLCRDQEGPMRDGNHARALRAGRRRSLGALIAVGWVVGASFAVPAGSVPARPAGALNLNAGLDLASQLGSCPPDTPATVDACAERTVKGLVPGLGAVTASYTFFVTEGPPLCPAEGSGKALATTIRLVVVGKGDIDVAVAEGAQCIDIEGVRTQTQTFVIRGGAGLYTGASGGGKLERLLGGDTPSGRRGTETWTGTLAVPALEFDLARPTLTGAVDRTARAPLHAKTVRVRFTVKAHDAVDGPLPVTCAPRSGSRFKIGKTRVTCSATDKSANRATAKFSVTVKASH
jgi:hypothetical protein